MIPNEKIKPGRSIIVIFYGFIGIISSFIWVIYRNDIIKIISSIKKTKLDIYSV